MPVFEKRTHIDAPASRVFAFHERPDAFELLQPPDDDTRVIEKSVGIDVGARVVVDTKVGPFTQRIVAIHTKYEAGRMFQDTMETRPLREMDAHPPGRARPRAAARGSSITSSTSYRWARWASSAEAGSCGASSRRCSRTATR